MKRLLFALRRAVLLFFVGCAGDPAVVADADLAEPAAPRTGRARDEAPIDVAGVVASERAAPVDGRRVVVVDRRGVRHEARTGADGRFGFHDVAPPYDLAIEPEARAATAYLGLRRAAPYIEERSAVRSEVPSQIVRLAAPCASCGARPCRVALAASSASGAGAAERTCQGSDDDLALALDVAHAWGRAPAPGEDVDVRVVVTYDDAAAFAFAHVVVAGAAGEVSELPHVALVPVPAFEVDVEAGGPLARSGWGWTTELSLELAAGQALVLASAEAPSLRARVPLLPGAALRVSAAAVHPRADARGGFHRGAEAWSGALAPGRRSVSLDVALGPEPRTPTEGARLTRDSGFAWQGAGRPALTVASLGDVVRGEVRLRALTNEDAIPSARLRALGIPELLPGEHVFDLATVPGASVDEAVSADVSERRRRLDRSRPGAATALRVPFVVTP